MKCPACEHKLHEKKLAGITIHICHGECGGLWFNRFQLKKLKALKPGMGQSLLTIERAEGVKFYRGAEHICPDCKTTLLHRHFFSAEGDIEIDQCAKCSGFWVDLAGLAKLQSLPEDGKERTIENYFSNVIDKKLASINIVNEDQTASVQTMIQIIKFLCPEKYLKYIQPSKP